MRIEVDSQVLPGPGPHELDLIPSLFPSTLLMALTARTWPRLLEPQPRTRPRLLVVTHTLVRALDSCPFSRPPSKLSRQSATEIPLPMLPLADTEKLIREKDEEVSKRLASPPTRAPRPLWSPSLASPGPIAAILLRTAAPHARDAGENAGADATEPGSGRAVGRALRP